MSFFPENLQKIQKPLNLAIKYLSYQPRTVYEIRQYLRKKDVNEHIAGKIIEYLLEKQYLNDMAFAKLFVESRVKNRPKSKFAFQYELKKKGICPTIIDDILKDYDDEELALKSLNKKIKTWHNLDDEKFKKKILNYLKYRGFNYDTCISALNHFSRSND